MHSVIVAVEIPKDFNNQLWLGFLSTVELVNKSAAISQLAENVWQINFQKSPTTFARLIDGIRKHNLKGKILTFADEPQWLLVDSNPTSR